MTIDVSGFGLQVRITASRTFPSGFTVTQFADDGDPLDVPSVQIGDAAKGLNGDLITWTIANAIGLTMNVIPGSEDEKNLAALFAANFPQKGKSAEKDIINITLNWPNGDIDNYTGGVMTDAMPGNSVAGSGRKKTKAFAFKFEGINNS